MQPRGFSMNTADPRIVLVVVWMYTLKTLLESAFLHLGPATKVILERLETPCPLPDGLQFPGRLATFPFRLLLPVTEITAVSGSDGTLMITILPF